MTMRLCELVRYRDNPLFWFQGFGRFQDEQTRVPTRGRANVLQRRMFEHYRRCQAERKPCRMVVLKYRRAGSSTGSEALIYTHAHNYNARLGVVGTDYKASANMLQMLAFFGEHDDFPGWGARPSVAARAQLAWQEWEGARMEDGNWKMENPESQQALDAVPWDRRVDKIIATRIVWQHGSTAELYTASNPESARSAGLNGYHATEVGRWPSGGQLDAAETLTSMRNTLPKSGFHLAIEESTANGAQGAFYDTCRNARWPDYAEWPALHQSCWPLNESQYGRDLQFMFIFAAWFEDERHFDPLTPEQAARVEATLDAEAWYLGEKELIGRYSQEGPKGARLGGEVNATVWEQLAWRRGIIKNVCTRRGLDEFAQEYPSNPLEAFRASGAPVFDSEGVLALDAALRAANRAECELMENDATSGLIGRDAGGLSGKEAGMTNDERASAGGSLGAKRGLRKTSEAGAQIQVWEESIPGCRHLVVVDPTKTAEIIKGAGERDRNSVLVLRDAYMDARKRWHPVKLVARVKSPNQYEDALLCPLIARLSKDYGGAIVVVESNLGSGLITRLRDEYRLNLYCRENWSATEQQFSKQYGWTTDEASRRLSVSTLQEFIREQRIEILCPNVIAELKTFVFNSRGRAEAASGAHDDDVMALAIGLACLPHATLHPVEVKPVQVNPVDDHLWKEE